MWALATEYLPWFALECHFTPDQVYAMPWHALVRLTLAADDREQQARDARSKANTQQRPMRRMT